MFIFKSIFPAILCIFCISFQLFNLILCGYRGFAIGVPVQGDGVG